MKKLYLFVSLIALSGLGASAAKSEIAIFHGYGYTTAMSPNGRYVVGNLSGGTDAFIYDGETNEITILASSDVAQNCEAKAVSNDGTVVGCLNDIAASWKDGVWNETYFGDESASSWLTGISADGTVIAGVSCNKALEATPYLFKNGEKIALEYPDMNRDGDSDVQSATTLGFVNGDPNLLIGMHQCDIGVRAGLIWDLTKSNMATWAAADLGPDGQYYASLDPTNVTADGIICLYAEELGYSYAYDIANNKTTEITSTGGLLCCTFEDNYITAGPANTLYRTGYVVTPDGEVTLQEWMLDKYGIDMTGEGLEETGCVQFITSDKTRMCGYGGTAAGISMYYIKLGDKEGGTAPLKLDLENAPLVYANNGSIHIDNATKGAQFSITDMSGKTINKGLVSGAVSVYVAGLYIVKVEQDGVSHLYKVIVK